MKRHIEIFDSTLRDGAQAEGIAFTVADKLNIVKALDRLGVKYIEAGNPASNPKDLEFFEKIKSLKLENSQIVAFGSTRRRGNKAEEDEGVRSLLGAGTETVTVFGKAWTLHVEKVLRATPEENLEMIYDTISYIVAQGRRVLFDAEHFFDGYKENPEYALKALGEAVRAGASSIILCETNGGAFPSEVYEITKKVVNAFPGVLVGIHCHNDCGQAVACSVMAVEAGASQVQGTYVGFGERCGNANLSTIIGNLQLKRDYICIPPENLTLLTQTAHEIALHANMILDGGMPFVGKSAFAHKGGMHIDGVSKDSRSFEHIEPGAVGNERRFLMSEVSGRSTVLKKIAEIAPDVTRDSEEITKILDKIKEREHKGYQFEGAEASFELLVLKALGRYKPFFELEYFKTTGERLTGVMTQSSSTAVIKISVQGRNEIAAAEGDGPVNALDKAMRKVLEVFYPSLSCVTLTDYRVRVMEAHKASASSIRVIIESTDGVRTWTTVGVSTDIIQASYKALVDSIEYKLYKDCATAVC